MPEQPVIESHPCNCTPVDSAPCPDCQRCPACAPLGHHDPTRISDRAAIERAEREDRNR